MYNTPFVINSWMLVICKCATQPLQVFAINPNLWAFLSLGSSIMLKTSYHPTSLMTLVKTSFHSHCLFISKYPPVKSMKSFPTPCCQSLFPLYYHLSINLVFSPFLHHVIVKLWHISPCLKHPFSLPPANVQRPSSLLLFAFVLGGQ